MTHDDIERWMAARDAGDPSFAYLAVERLAPGVEYGWLWEATAPDLRRCDFHDVYFLLHDDACIGAVLPMKDDVHTYLRPAWRGRGLFEPRFRGVVLPHLFRDGRALQRITFEEPAVARHFEHMGFRVDWNLERARFEGSIDCATVARGAAHHRGVACAFERSLACDLLAARDDGGMALFVAAWSESLMMKY